jgi:hypothetical protein
MGVYIRLSILPEKINQNKWEEVYGKTLQLLDSYPFAHLKKVAFFNTNVLSYVNSNNETDEYWTVSGDLESKRFAESFTLYKDVSHYHNNSKSQNIFDAVENNLDTSVFDSKTQGYSYHTHILGIAMLIEHFFPNAAMVSGDFDLKQCEKAKKWVDEVLSTNIDLPIRMNIEKLLSIENSIGFLQKWYLADEETLFHTAYTYFPIDEFSSWMNHSIKDANSPSQIGVLKNFIYWLNTTNDLDGLVKLSCFDSNGPKFDFNDFIKALCKTWIMMPREDFSFLKVFDKVDGHPMSVERQFGMMFLDMSFTGREIRYFMPKEQVILMLNKYVSDNENLDDLLNEELLSIKEHLHSFKNSLGPVLETVESSTDEVTFLADDDAFLYFDEKTILFTEEQLKYVKYNAYALRKMIEQLNNITPEQMNMPLDEMKELLANLLTHEIKMSLTEDSWKQIENENDRLRLHILLAKVMQDKVNPQITYQKTNTDFRKGLFENRALFEKIYSFIQDDELMETIQNEIKSESE